MCQEYHENHAQRHENLTKIEVRFLSEHGEQKYVFHTAPENVDS